MPHARRRLGDRGEHIAYEFLAKHGYVVLAENFRCPSGEIDLVCRDGDALAFVEVKLRRGNAFGEPEEAVTPAKLRHIAAAAACYMNEHASGDASWRIDVVAVALDTAGRIADIRLIRGAGEW